MSFKYGDLLIHRRRKYKKTEKLVTFWRDAPELRGRERAVVLYPDGTLVTVSRWCLRPATKAEAAQAMLTCKARKE